MNAAHLSEDVLGVAEPAASSLSVQVGDLLCLYSYLFDHDGAVSIGHSLRVARLVDLLHRRVTGRPASSSLCAAALLADIGGCHLTPHVVQKLVERPDLLGQKEDVDIFFHPFWGAALLRKAAGLHEAAKLVAMHHEGIGGRGYPLGMRLAQTSPEARILHTADSALLSLRVCAGQRELMRDHLRIVERDQYDDAALDALDTVCAEDDWCFDLAAPQDAAAWLRRARDGFSMEEPLLAGVGLWQLMSMAADVMDRRIYPTLPGHQRNVMRLSLRMAEAMGLEADVCNDCAMAALLQNVGAAMLDTAALRRNLKLSEEDRQRMEQHPRRGGELLDIFPTLSRLADVVRRHHENFNGSGYPDGLAGEDIPLPARIIRVADSWEAQVAARSYSAPRTHRKAVREMRRFAGNLYDPAVVDVLIAVVDS